jgi:hypothetical protein
MAAAPTYAANPRSIDRAVVSAANTNRDGSGTIVSIATGSAAGFKVMEVVAQATVTTTAGMIRLFISTDSGSTWDLFDELPVGAVTVSASISAFRAVKNYNNLVLTGTTNRLGASTHNAEAFEVYALGADL